MDTYSDNYNYFRCFRNPDYYCKEGKMKNSYSTVHYNENLRPYTKYPFLFCSHLSDAYFKSCTGRLLDICCGRGEHIEIFNKLGFETYGIDKEGAAKSRNLNVKIADVDLEDLPYEDNFFDFVMIKSAIEHIGNIYHVMENVYRVLKPGGRIVILTCDWKIAYKIFYDDVDHKTPFTKFSLKDLLLRYDFKNVRIEDFYHLPYTWRGIFFRIFPRIVSFLIPIDFPQTVRLNPFIKMVKFSRERQILAYGEK